MATVSSISLAHGTNDSVTYLTTVSGWVQLPVRLDYLGVTIISFDWQEGSTMSSIICVCDHWWHLKIVELKRHEGWACFEINADTVRLLTPGVPSRSALQLKAR